MSTTTLRFNLASTRGGVCYYPANESANLTLAALPGKKRKALLPHELFKLLSDGLQVEVNLKPYLGMAYWVALYPVEAKK